MAGTGIDMTDDKAVQFTLDRVHVKWGHLSRPLPVTTKRVQSRGSVTYFAKMTAKEPWLLHATFGTKRGQETSFVRTSLLDALREKLQRACNGECRSERAEEEADDEDRDFMDDIDVSDHSQSPRKQTDGAKRAR